MKTDSILQADLLDIIFENRNKEYGAYTLRKDYNNRLYQAMGITFLAAAIICTFSFFKKPDPVYIFTGPPLEMGTPPAPVKKTETPSEKKKLQKTETASAKASSQKFTSKIKITDDHVPPPITNLDDNIAIGQENVKGKPVDIIDVSQKFGGKDVFVVKPDSSLKSADHTTPLNVAEIMPSYPGGMNALRKFLERNLSNPQDLNEEQIISVKIKFVVGYDGKLKSFQTVEDGGLTFNNEVIRVLKKMPDWIPGKTNGENVSVYFTIPVKFTSTE